jgi:hypothetical protein
MEGPKYNYIDTPKETILIEIRKERFLQIKQNLTANLDKGNFWEAFMDLSELKVVLENMVKTSDSDIISLLIELLKLDKDLQKKLNGNTSKDIVSFNKALESLYIQFFQLSFVAISQLLLDYVNKSKYSEAIEYLSNLKSALENCLGILSPLKQVGILDKTLILLRRLRRNIDDRSNIDSYNLRELLNTQVGELILMKERIQFTIAFNEIELSLFNYLNDQISREEVLTIISNLKPEELRCLVAILDDPIKSESSLTSILSRFLKSDIESVRRVLDIVRKLRQYSRKSITSEMQTIVEDQSASLQDIA